MKKKLLMAFGALGLGIAFAAVPNNTILIMSSSDIPTMDPAQAYDTASSEPIENVYESLLAYKGKSITTPAPALATDWKISTDGKKYTFNLQRRQVPQRQHLHLRRRRVQLRAFARDQQQRLASLVYFECTARLCLLG